MEGRKHTRTREKDKERKEKVRIDKDAEKEKTEKKALSPSPSKTAPPLQPQGEESWEDLVEVLMTATSTQAEKLAAVAAFLGITGHHDDLRPSIVLDYHFLNLLWLVERDYDLPRIRFLFNLGRSLLEASARQPVDGLTGTPLGPAELTDFPSPYGMTIAGAFTLMKEKVLEVTGTSTEKMLFSLEDSRKICDYFGSTILQHFRIFTEVLSSPQTEDRESLDVAIMTAAPPLPLLGAETEEQVRLRAEQKRKEEEEAVQRQKEAEKARLAVEEAEQKAWETDRNAAKETTNVASFALDEARHEEPVDEKEVIPAELLARVASHVAAEQMLSLRAEMDQMLKQHQMMLDERIAASEAVVRKLAGDS